LGAPLSPVIVDFILQRLESSILNDLTYKPTFYYRYVDDIALSVSLSQLNGLVVNLIHFITDSNSLWRWDVMGTD